MTGPTGSVAIIVFYGVMLCWLLFAAVFFFRSRPPKPTERQRDSNSIAGIVVAATGFALVWSVRRPWGSPFLNGQIVLEVVIGCLTLAIAALSVLLVHASVKRLGKQWSLTAKLVEEHEFVTDGPYAVVRHPIYTGMLGMMLATGVANSQWYVVAPAMFLGWVGTMIRVRSEEKLLREKFGDAFLRYAERVPALIPFRLRP